MNYMSEIQKLLAIFEKPYSFYNDMIKQTVCSKKFFIGSNDYIGYYEPELTDYLWDKRSRCGNFSVKTPKAKKYFEYWYDRDDKLIKIKYKCPYEFDCYDVIVRQQGDNKFYLFYDYDNIESTVKMSGIYKLEYTDGLLMTITKYFRNNYINKWTIHRSEYTYTNKKLHTADVMTDTQSFYEFFYGDDGYMNFYILKEGLHTYNANVDRSIIQRFEKFGLYHFSGCNDN